MSALTLPLLLHHWYSMRPTRLLNQHFGMGLDTDDLMSPLTVPSDIRAVMPCSNGYHRLWRSEAAKSDSGSTISATDDKYQVHLDVQHFAPEEIHVKAYGNNIITVEGKHKERQDAHGSVFRHFVRKYILPEGYDINNIVSNLSADGVLSITAPRTNTGDDEHRPIPIQQTGIPIKAV